MHLEPIEDRILIRPIKKDETSKTEGGIIIPDTVKKEVSEGEVVSVGAGRYAYETGQFIPTILSPKDLVLYGTNQGLQIEVDKEILILMRESDVLGKIGRKE